jgi:inositol-pentakisphosphate 2-kinase
MTWQPSSLSRLAAEFSGLELDVKSLADLLPPFTEALLPLLMDTPLLSILSHLQRTLDPLDIEGLSKIWSRSNPGVPLGEGEPDPSLAEWDDFIRAYLSAREANLRYSILAYLLSATFKDCSIILRLGKNGVKDTITAIDLDPKSVSRLAKWEALDQEIVTSFMDVTAEREACIDTRKVES